MSVPRLSLFHYHLIESISEASLHNVPQITARHMDGVSIYYTALAPSTVVQGLREHLYEDVKVEYHTSLLSTNFDDRT